MNEKDKKTENLFLCERCGASLLCKGQKCAYCGDAGLKESKTNKKTTHIKPLLLIMGAVLIFVVAVVLAIIPRGNFYYSDDFASLSVKEKTIEILKREGENMLNDDPNSYCIYKTEETAGIYYEFILYYDAVEDQLGMELKIRDGYEYTLSLFLNQGSNYHSLWMKVMDGQSLEALGSIKMLYAPTFYLDCNMSFDYYDGYAEPEALSLTNSSLHILLITINDMVKEYNFSVAEYGFYCYVNS